MLWRSSPLILTFSLRVFSTDEIEKNIFQFKYGLRVPAITPQPQQSHSTRSWQKRVHGRRHENGPIISSDISAIPKEGRGENVRNIIARFGNSISSTTVPSSAY